MGFKYGGTITCIGMVTNLIGEDFAPIDNCNVFEKIQFSANEALRELLPTKEKKTLYFSSNSKIIMVSKILSSKNFRFTTNR